MRVLPDGPNAVTKSLATLLRFRKAADYNRHDMWIGWNVGAGWCSDEKRRALKGFTCNLKLG
jgi:hypothetical protein